MTNLERIQQAEQAFGAQAGPTLSDVMRGKYGHARADIDDESREPEVAILESLANGPSWLDIHCQPGNPKMSRNILARHRLLLLGLIEDDIHGWRIKRGDA